jgi:hypothetical protein
LLLQALTLWSTSRARASTEYCFTPITSTSLAAQYRLLLLLLFYNVVRH